MAIHDLVFMVIMYTGYYSSSMTTQTVPMHVCQQIKREVKSDVTVICATIVPKKD